MATHPAATLYPTLLLLLSFPPALLLAKLLLAGASTPKPQPRPPLVGASTPLHLPRLPLHLVVLGECTHITRWPEGTGAHGEVEISSGTATDLSKEVGQDENITQEAEPFSDRLDIENSEKLNNSVEQLNLDEPHGSLDFGMLTKSGDTMESDDLIVSAESEGSEATKGSGESKKSEGFKESGETKKFEKNNKSGNTHHSEKSHESGKNKARLQKNCTTGIIPQKSKLFKCIVLKLDSTLSNYEYFTKVVKNKRQTD